MKDQAYLEKAEQSHPSENVFAPISSDMFKVGQLPEPRPNGDALPSKIVSAATITGDEITFHANKSSADKPPATTDKPGDETEKPPTGEAAQTTRPYRIDHTRGNSYDEERAMREKMAADRTNSLPQEVDPNSHTSRIAANHPLHAGH